MIKYFFKIINIFLFSEKIFKKPKKTDILFYDNAGFFFLKKLIPKKTKYDIVDIRYDSINIAVIISCLKKFFFSKKNYIQEYINFTNPKIIITFNDLDINFYLLKKKNPNIKFISIQNGKRNNEFFKKIKKIKNLESDFIFCFGNYIKRKYEAHIKANVVSVGSLKNNFINFSKKKFSFISCISEYSDAKNEISLDSKKSISSNYFYNTIQKIILKLLIKYCRSVDRKLVVILRSNYSIKEKNYFLEIKNKYYKKLIIFYPKNQTSVYHKCDESEFVVAINSTLGLENISRGGKTLFINPRPLLFNIKDDNFFWPGKIKSLIYKIFISKITNFNFNEKIKNFEKINWAEYKKDIKFYNIMNFDKDNKTIKKVILNYL
jgi:surface carbohydrate biosynthesis protein